MKQQVFYIHGGESYENYDRFLERLRTKDIWDLPFETPKVKWTQNFASELGSDFEVFMPAMPNKQNAKYEEWKIWFERHFEHLRDDVILIGLSLGAMFLVKYLIETKTPFQIKALYLMGCPVSDPDFADEDCGTFRFSLDSVSVLSERAGRVFVVHSKDDFLVPYEHALKFQKALPMAELVTFEDKNHFLIEEFPELITHIKGLS